MENYEQKYKDAIESIKKIKEANKSNMELVSSIEEFFPELAEIDDEVIRESLLMWMNRSGHISIAGIPVRNITAWIEKQAGRKCTEKIKPVTEGLKTEFQKQVSRLIASVINREFAYTQECVKLVAQSMLEYAQNELRFGEWSEEDERMKHFAYCRVYEYEKKANDIPDSKMAKECMDWLRNLRPPYYCDDCKMKKSVTGWKPSEKQMEVLWELIAGMKLPDNEKEIEKAVVVTELFEQLKAL